MSHLEDPVRGRNRSSDSCAKPLGPSTGHGPRPPQLASAGPPPSSDPTEWAQQPRAILRRRVRTILGHHSRRARHAGHAIGYGPDALRALVAAALGRPCPHCRALLSARSFGIDHAAPTSRGGSWGLANLHVVCMRCNETKGGLTEAEYSSLLALLATWPEETRRATLARLRAGGRIGR